MNEDRKYSRKERRASQIRRQIVDAAASLFAEKGFHKTTTKDIALAADVSEGTIYNYFQNKDDLLLGIIEQLANEEQLDMHFLTSLHEDAGEFFISRLMHQQEKIAKKNPMIQAILSEILFNAQIRQRYYSQILTPVMDQLNAHLKSRMELGQIRNISSEHLARLLVSLITGLYLLQAMEDDVVESEWEELSKTISSVIFDGIKAKI